eukprot:CAMPEP_0177583538 /NCGR_PEP_ID=MMETSP0419_2-20121207/3378_1 /TAXON_ID=582737 /ORGANISM="Tetraselmis sp., Strain GSL018" /LENGTH=125 /DNA_ID=CAMNT_0019072941 /DNA_START=59 /DNA_END=433 /DNA_ORIENTATION=-
MFAGFSTLRKKQEDTVQETEAAKKLKAYLKKYTDGTPGNELTVQKQKKKKKKLKNELSASARAIDVVDEDISGFAAVDLKRDAADTDEDDEYRPVVANPKEAERAKRLVEKEKNRFKIGEDGSGW